MFPGAFSSEKEKYVILGEKYISCLNREQSYNEILHPL